MSVIVMQVPSVDEGRALTVRFEVEGLNYPDSHAVRIVLSEDHEGQLDVIDLSAEQMDCLVAAWYGFAHEVIR